MSKQADAGAEELPERMADWLARRRNQARLRANRHTRRLFVLATAIPYLAIPVLYSLFPENRWARLAAPALLLLAVLGLFAVYVTAGTMFSRQFLLDERQTRVRDRAYFIAFRLLAAIYAVVLAYVFVATMVWQGHLWLPRLPVEWFAALAFGSGLLSALPMSVAAWTEGEPPGA